MVCSKTQRSASGEVKPPNSSILSQALYYSAIQSLYGHVVYNVLVSFKANRERDQLGTQLDSELIVI